MKIKHQFINAKAVRQLSLDTAKRIRPAHPFSRVSDEFLARIDAAVRSAVLREVQQHPSKGVTLK